MLFRSKKPKIIEEEEVYTFKPFHETYKWIAFTLTVGLMYPNPATERVRLALIVGVLMLTPPEVAMVLIDLYMCWRKRDIFNIIRHSTIVGPFLGVFYKMFLMYYKRVQAKELIDEMNRDYASYNHLPRRYQAVAAAHIQSNVHHAEHVWATTVGGAIMSFPLVAVISTLYSYTFDEIPKRYMIHDMNRPFREPEARFESPFFEFQFVYMLGCAVLCVLNYTAYDALFGILTSHACLKMNIYCMQLEDAFRSEDHEHLHRQVQEFIRAQQNMFRFGELIQDTFNVWLGTILFGTMIQTGSLLFHISAGYGFDLRYTVFSFCSVMHIFLPCKHAADLKTMSMDTATLVYCSGWERANSQPIRRMIPFVIARAQLPIQIVAFNILDYDMELFVAIMRTSYSMFTLLQS